MKLRLGSSCNMQEYSFERLKKYGYDCGDFQMANTNDEIYHVPHDEFVKRLEAVKGYADKHGIVIHQMHGPWTWPPPEEKSENREKRFEQMSKSISAAQILGCKYWVIHPMLPFGTHDIHLNKEKENRDFNLEYFSRLTEVAKKLHYDPSWLSREIKRKTGKTFTQLIQEKRLAQAAFLLKNTDRNVSDISLAVGYENASYFYRIFENKYGKSPRHYRVQERTLF
jgi:AraC-like DNA-binding protein